MGGEPGPVLAVITGEKRESLIDDLHFTNYLLHCKIMFTCTIES